MGLPVPTIKFSSSSFSMFSSQQILAISGVGVVSGIVTLCVYLPNSRLKYTVSALCFLLFENIKAIINKFYEKTKVPNYIKPLFAGIVCSIAAYFSFPQTVSHGFLTTNQIIGMSSLSFNESRKFFLLKLYSFAWSNVSRIIGKFLQRRKISFLLMKSLFRRSVCSFVLSWCWCRKPVHTYLVHYLAKLSSELI